MDDLLISPVERERFVDVLAALLSEGVRAHGAWGGMVAAAFAALADSSGGVLVLQCGHAAYAFGSGIPDEMLRSVGRPPLAPSVVPDDLTPARTRAWCREASAGGATPSSGRAPVDRARPGLLYEAVGLTADLGLDEAGRASLACHFRAPRGGAETQRLVELFRLLLPAFHTTSRTRLIALTAARRSREQAAVADSTGSARATARVLREKCGLTPRELEVARLLMSGGSNAEIADTLGISPYTARHHTERILGKLGVRSRAAVPGTVQELVQRP